MYVYRFILFPSKESNSLTLSQFNLPILNTYVSLKTKIMRKDLYKNERFN